MWLTRFQYTVAASGEREGLERCGSPGFNPQSPRSPTDFTGMYPVPATPRAYHPSFTRGIVQAILVVPQGCAIVNSKPYPACLFLLSGPSVYRYPWGTNINIAAAAEKTSPTSPCRRPHQQESRRATALAWLAATLHRKLCRRPRTRRGDYHSRPRRTKPTCLRALCPCRLPDRGTQAYQGDHSVITLPPGSVWAAKPGPFGVPSIRSPKL